MEFKCWRLNHTDFTCYTFIKVIKLNSVSQQIQLLSHPMLHTETSRLLDKFGSILLTIILLNLQAV